jgi:hypothetical protein
MRFGGERPGVGESWADRKPDFRWLLAREDSPWYPTMRLFRQEALGDWRGVVERVRQALSGAIADG